MWTVRDGAVNLDVAPIIQNCGVVVYRLLGGAHGWGWSREGTRALMTALLTGPKTRIASHNDSLQSTL
jgi:hypothetical protein